MKRTIFILLLVIIQFRLKADSVWYHPNPWWKVESNIVQRKQVEPFEYRWFFPQFSYPHQWTGDKWSIAGWNEWMNYNKFEAPHELNGHSWQVFINTNSEILKKNPEFLALQNGMRVGFGKTNKLCISNKKLQALYLKDALKRFARLNSKQGFISVEPSDGDGYCDCNNCKKIGSVSNQVFYLANQTAKEIKKRYPQGGVNLLAYYKHADPPTFSLEPNVHVTVVPSGFQDLYDGDVLMYLWKLKTSNLTYYDYFAIPQWKGELPRIEIHNYLRRLNIARKLKYKGFWFEAGLSLPSTIALQLINQMWQNTQLRWNDVFDDFINRCFPNAKLPMSNLFTRWFNSWDADNEFKMSLEDIADAEKLPLTVLEKKRIMDIKVYLLYIQGYQKWMEAKQTEDATVRFFNLIYSIANRRVVNTSAIFQLFSNKISNVEIRKKYNLLTNKNWQWMQIMSDSQVQTSFKSNLLYYRKQPQVKNNLQEKNVYETGKPVGFKYWNTIIIKGTGGLIELSLNSTDYTTAQDGLQYVSIVDEKGALILNDYFSLKTSIKFLSVKNVNYRLTCKQIFNGFLKMEKGPQEILIEQ